MSYEFYKILHIIGLLLTVFGLFGLSSVLWNDSAPKPQLRKIWIVSHGVGLLLLLVAGFGLAARLGLAGQLPGWIYAKLAIWLLVGGSLSLVKRKPRKSALWTLLIFVLVILAVILAVTKPF
jgi:uncharacterized membrane protein